MGVNIQRLKQDLDDLAAIGKGPCGITRPAFSAADLKAREWLIAKMEEAGLKMDIDDVGNIRGRLYDDKSGPAIACGSHIDTVNCGGHLDGALGVLSGLEALRCISEQCEEGDVIYPLELIVFSDEEGRFGHMLGSGVFAGLISPQDLQDSEDIDGVKLLDCMHGCGFDLGSVMSVQDSTDAYKVYLELHIEQGPVLDRLDIPVGIVTSITGLFKWKVTVIGQANHAGTTPMNMRRDAFQGLVGFAKEIDNVLDKYGGVSSKATIGKVDVRPGSPNVVPGLCEFSLEVRDPSQDVLNDLEESFKGLAIGVSKENDLDVEITPISLIQATACSPEIVDTVRQAAEACDIPYKLMPSGAAHDAQNMACIADIGMIFVPSINGVSHNPEENTDIRDIERGANVLLEALLRLTRL